MDKTSKGSGRLSPDITMVSTNRKGEGSKGRCGQTKKKNLTTTTPTPQTILVDTKNEKKEFYPEPSSSSSSIGMENDSVAEGEIAEPELPVTFAVDLNATDNGKRRGRPKRILLEGEDTGNVEDTVNVTANKPQIKVKEIAKSIKLNPKKTSNGKSLTKVSKVFDMDVTDSIIRKETADEETEGQTTPSTSAVTSPTTPEPSQVGSSIKNSLISPDMTSFSASTSKVEKKYDPNFIPGLDLLGGNENESTILDTTTADTKLFFEKVNEKMAGCSIVSTDSKLNEPKVEDAISQPKGDDSSKIRRSSRIKKLETRRGSVRRREVVFSTNSDRDSGCGNLSRSSSLASMLDDDSNSSNLSHFSVSTPALSVDSNSPPLGDRFSTISIGSNSSSGVLSTLSSSTLKLKSRWRFSLDAESFKSNSYSDGSNELSLPVYGEHGSSEGCFSTTPEYKLNQKLVNRPGYITHDADDEELLEKLAKFEGIEENIFKTERRMSKDSRGMVCDCYLTQEDISRGDIGCNEDCLNRLLMIECGSRCPVGDRCTNKKFQRKEYCPVEVFKTEKKGHGLRTMQQLTENGFVIEYVGEVLDPREFKHRTKEYAKSNQEHFYFMALKSDSIVDATLRGNCSRFINHSCEPNCETQKWTVNGELRIGFFAIRDLDAGEEITFDYQFQRYGKKAQQCFCMTSSCRGWIGGENEDDQGPEQEHTKGLETAEQGQGKVKVKVEKKRRKEIVLEDIALEEELTKLEQTGLMNKNHTLTLCRLMVRADDWDDRERILNILINGEKPCRRLFLDYHGLRLLWGWMLDLPLPTPDAETQAIRTDCYHLLILRALASLPIPNKSLLQDSKVLVVVEKWSCAPSSSKFIVKKVKPEISEATSSDSRVGSTPDVSDNVEPVLDLASVRLSDPAECASVAFTPEALPNPIILDNKGCSQSEEILEPTISCPSTLDCQENLSNVFGKEPVLEEIKSELIADREDFVEEFHNFEFVETAKDILQSWAGLQEVFRIPKKERVEQMKEHEREADFWDDRDKAPEKDRSFSRLKHGRSKNERRERHRDRDYEHHQNRSGTSHSNLSKQQRRNLFAAEVARAEQEERNRRMQDEMVSLHQERCSRLGLDVTTVPIVDPSCTYYLEPTTVTWKAIVLDDPNLPPELAMIVHSSQYPQPEENLEIMTPESEFVFPPWPEGLLPPPPLPPAILPRSWKMSVDDEGRCYYYHVRTRHTQWFPPSPELSGGGSESSDSAAESDEEVEGEGNCSEGTLSTSEQQLLRAQAYTKFNASRLNERSEKRKKAGLVQVRIISPRSEEERPLISQKSIRARKVQLMEQKIQEAKKAESLGIGLVISHPTTSHPVTISTTLSLDSSMSHETKEEELNECLTSLTQKRSRRHRERDKGRERDVSTGSQPLKSVSKSRSHSKSIPQLENKKQKDKLLQEIGIGPSVESESRLNDPIDSTLMTVATSINSENIGYCASDITEQPLTPPTTTTTIQNFSESSSVLLKSPVVISNSRTEIHNAKKLAERLNKISEKKKSHKRSKASSTVRKRLSQENETTKSGSGKKVKGACMDDFRSQIANVVVQYLNPYKKSSCKAGHIVSTEDFKHLARKMTHTIMLKELKHCRAGKPLLVNDNVKHKMKEFVKKYMAKYGERSYARSPEDSHSLTPSSSSSSHVQSQS